MDPFCSSPLAAMFHLPLLSPDLPGSPDRTSFTPGRVSVSPSDTQGGSRVPELGPLGSVRGGGRSVMGVPTAIQFTFGPDSCDAAPNKRSQITHRDHRGPGVEIPTIRAHSVQRVTLQQACSCRLVFNRWSELGVGHAGPGSVPGWALSARRSNYSRDEPSGQDRTAR